jgi:hypothetical protein
MLALVIGAPGGQADRAATALTGAGWHVEARSAVAPTCEHVPTLVLLDAAPGELLATILSAPWRRGACVVAFCDPGHDWRSVGYDGHLPADADDLGTLAGCWVPQPLSAATLRVTEAFGRDAIRPMLEGFAETLEDALVALRDRNARSLAHRVAGIAGTLGFGDLGQAWLALSEGRESDVDALRRDTRLAIGAIARAA